MTRIIKYNAGSKLIRTRSDAFYDFKITEYIR